MKRRYVLLSLTGASTIVRADDQARARFDIASVKASGPEPNAANDIMRGGPGTPEPQRIAWRVPLIRLIARAYDLDFDQIAGPKWLSSERYSLDALIPTRTTREQFAAMMKDLLAERFHLKGQLSRKEFPAHELIVSKNGPKLWKVGEAVQRSSGFPEPAAGGKFGRTMVMPRNVRLTFRGASMADLAQRLGWPLSAYAPLGGVAMGRVIDRTNLVEQYDFNLEYAGAWSPDGAFAQSLPEGNLDTAPLFFEAIRQQLGLELRQVKTQADFLTVEYVDRIPTPN